MKICEIVAASAMFAAVPAFAHHSYAMFDQTKEIKLMGTVKQFQFENPHSHILLSVVGADGKVTDWSIEAGSPNGMRRRGWRKDSLHAGEQITVVAHPTKNGTDAASLTSVTTAAGKTLK